MWQIDDAAAQQRHWFAMTQQNKQKEKQWLSLKTGKANIVKNIVVCWTLWTGNKTFKTVTLSFLNFKKIVTF